MTTNNPITFEEEVSSSKQSLRWSPLGSATWVNTSIIIDATALTNTTHSGNWTWAVAQDWCSGLGTFIEPYLIENMTFTADPGSNGLLIQNSVGIYFTIQNCTFINALSSGYAGLQLDDTDNGTIMACNMTNNHRGIYFKENCNYNTLLLNDVNSSSYIGMDIFNNCNYNNISYNTVTRADYSSWDYGQGIYLHTNCNYNYITYNNLSANDRGIKLSGDCNENQILNNNISNHPFEGIFIESNSIHNEIQYNLVADNYNGIFLSSAENNELSFNTVQNNYRNGIFLSYADNNDIFNNTLDSNALSNLVYSGGINLINSHFNQIFNNTANRSNLYSKIASNNTYIDNSFTNGGSARSNGMWLEDDSDNNTLINNMVTGYPTNIRSDDTRENQFIDNKIIDSGYTGLILARAPNSTLTGNVIINSAQGISVSGSDNITISNNQISGCSSIEINLADGEYFTLTENTMEDQGLKIEDIYHNQIDTSNTVAGKTIYYFEDQNNLDLDGSVFPNLAQLFVINSTNSNITNFNIHQKSLGVYIARCVSLNINNNNISDNIGNGFRLIGVNDSIIDSNIITNNSNGIIFEGEFAPAFDEENPDFDLLSGNNVFSNNYICYNTRAGIEGAYGHHDEFSENIIMNNSYEGIAIYYEHFASFKDNIVSNNSEGIYIGDSMNYSISDNEIQFNLNEGIYADYAIDSTIIGNLISGNKIGIELIDIQNSDVLENTINNHLEYGLYCGNADNATISGNIFIATNGTGVYLDSDSEENLLYQNIFLDNGVHAEDDGVLNDWYLDHIGNYWDNYTGTDLDTDGIGDTSYEIGGLANSTDLYPIFNVAPIFIEIPVNATFTVNQSQAQVLNWTLQDACTWDATYRLLINGTEVTSGSWENATQFSYDLTNLNLTAGDYNVTLIAFDGLGYSTQISVVITINPEIEAPTKTSGWLFFLFGVMELFAISAGVLLILKSTKPETYNRIMEKMKNFTSRFGKSDKTV